MSLDQKGPYNIQKDGLKPADTTPMIQAKKKSLEELEELNKRSKHMIEKDMYSEIFEWAKNNLSENPYSNLKELVEKLPSKIEKHDLDEPEEKEKFILESEIVAKILLNSFLSLMKQSEYRTNEERFDAVIRLYINTVISNNMNKGE